MRPESYHENMPDDPRDPPVLRILDFPDPPLHLIVPSRPRVEEAETDASIHLARMAQQRDRAAVVEANLANAADELVQSSLLDSVNAQKVAAVLPADMTHQDRQQAGAVAVRLFDPEWQTISRYRAADAALMALRTFLVAHGLCCTVEDADLRVLADRIAGLTHMARLRTWTGQDAVSDTTWCQARLGLLNLTDER